MADAPRHLNSFGVYKVERAMSRNFSGKFSLTKPLFFFRLGLYRHRNTMNSCRPQVVDL